MIGGDEADVIVKWKMILVITMVFDRAMMMNAKKRSKGNGRKLCSYVRTRVSGTGSWGLKFVDVGDETNPILRRTGQH